MAIVASGQLTLTDLNDAKQLAMYIGASQSRTVIFNGVSTYTPNYASTNQVLTPQLFIAGDNTDQASSAVAVRWFYQSNGAGTPTAITANTTDFTLGTGNKTLTIKTNIMSSRNSMTIICEMDFTDPDTGFVVTSKAELEIIKVTNGIDGNDGTSGSDAIIGVLSNESVVLPANSSGTVSSYTGAVSTLTIYKGATDDTANWTITQTLSSATVTASGTPANRTATVTAISANVATVTFTATRSGYATIEKTFTITKAIAGASGSSPTAYNMFASANVLTLNNTRTAFVPTSVTFSAKSQTGTATPADYSGRYKIYESTDGSTFTLKYTSSANENNKVYTPSGLTVKAVKAELFLAGGTTTKLDELTVNVVADGTNSIYANVWTPDGNSVKNGSGTVKAQIDLYNGTDVVTGSAYKWYVQDPTATTSSGGDADGGAGWRLLTSTYNIGITGYTTATITIPASAIAGTEAFKCVATYNGDKYGGVTTVVDLSDPIVVRLDGMDKFKNGEGSVTVRATLLQAGAEIDSAGTGYTYTWSIYNSSNVKTAFAKTGKSITVSATDIDGRGNLVCDVSK
jgi:hypothetical protein